MRIYRSEFNGDLIADLSEAQEALHPDPIRKAMEHMDLSGRQLTPEELQSEILSHIDYRDFSENRLPSFDSQEKALRYIWALAKNANHDLTGFEDWCDGFEEWLPLPAIIDACVQIFGEACLASIELKN